MRVTSVADATVFARATINVTQPVTNLVIAPPRATVPLSGTQKFRANTGVNWTVVEGPSGGTIDASGTYTASASAGVFHVKATSLSDATQQAVATVTVSGVLPRFAYVVNSTARFQRTGRMPTAASCAIWVMLVPAGRLRSPRR